MSKADDYARSLMNSTGGGSPIVSSGNPVPAVVRALDTPVDSAPEATRISIITPVIGENATLPVEQLQQGRYQPRGDIDPATLEQLAASIRAQGVVQPIIVRPVGAERYEIVAGERRWRAAQLAGLALVPVVVRDMDDNTAIKVALIENIQRDALNPLDEATALRTLVEHATKLTGIKPSQQMLADMVGKSVPWISKRLALLERPESVQQSVLSGVITVDEAARRPDGSGPGDPQPARAARKSNPRPTARVDARILQSSVKRLNTLADSLGLPGVDLPGKPARKDYVAAFEQRVMEILDAAHRSIKPE